MFTKKLLTTARYLSVVPRADGHEEATEEKTVQPGKDGGA